MKISILWAPVSGYMMDCWKALADRGHEINVLAVQSGENSNTDFQISDHPDVKIQLASDDMIRNRDKVREFLKATEPEALIVSGWWNSAFRVVTKQSSVPFIVVADNPYRGVVQSTGLRIRHGRFLKRAHYVAVPGERGFQLITRVGIHPNRVFQPMYGISENSRPIAQIGQRNGFLFAGQLIARKGVPQLLAAYRFYREESREPMPLFVAGLGPLEDLVKQEPGVEYLGFVQPSKLSLIREKAAFLVLPSFEDAWPLALVEAAHAGMGILCSTACGSSVEVVRNGWNGIKFQAGSGRDIANAMHWAEIQCRNDVPISQRSHELAQPYGASHWAIVWEQLLVQLAESEPE